MTRGPLPVWKRASWAFRTSLRQWQAQRKRRPLAQCALGAQGSLHSPRELAADRQSETGSLVWARQRPSHLHEWLKDRVEIGGGDADARIAHDDESLVSIDVRA